jgi:hypothetical protein
MWAWVEWAGGRLYLYLCLKGKREGHKGGQEALQEALGVEDRSKRLPCASCTPSSSHLSALGEGHVRTSRYHPPPPPSVYHTWV